MHPLRNSATVRGLIRSNYHIDIFVKNIKLSVKIHKVLTHYDQLNLCLNNYIPSSANCVCNVS